MSTISLKIDYKLCNKQNSRQKESKKEGKEKREHEILENCKSEGDVQGTPVFKHEELREAGNLWISSKTRS